MRHGVLLTALLLVACSRSPELTALDAAVPSTTTAAASSPGASSAAFLDAAAPVHAVAISVASFEKGSVLDQCVDYKVSSARAPDAGADPEGQLAASVLATLKTKTNELTRLGKPCEQQFPSRAALARCVLHSTQPIPHDPDAGPSLADAGTFDLDVGLSYYNLKTLETDDTYMKQCLSLKGDWQALDPHSAAYQDAVSARLRRSGGKP